jgi:peroxiredoxin Q/BCP
MKAPFGLISKDFICEDIFGRPISVNDFKGKKTLLTFYTFSSCPMCNLRVHQLANSHPELRDQGLQIIAIFESKKESMLEHLSRHEAPFTFVSDPDNKLYKLFGVKPSWLKLFRNYISLKWYRDAIAATKQGFKPQKVDGHMNSMPADFLIDANLEVKQSYYGKHTGDHMPIEEIQRFVHAL